MLSRQFTGAAGSNRLEVFGTGEFFLPVVKRPKALRLQLERRSHMKSVESPNAHFCSVPPGQLGAMLESLSE